MKQPARSFRSDVSIDLARLTFDHPLQLRFVDAEFDRLDRLVGGIEQDKPIVLVPMVPVDAGQVMRRECDAEESRTRQIANSVLNRLLKKGLAVAL